MVLPWVVRPLVTPLRFFYELEITANQNKIFEKFHAISIR